MVFYYMYECNRKQDSRAAAGESSMIDFEHVYKTYETHNDENVALEDINKMCIRDRPGPDRLSAGQRTRRAAD